MRREAKKKTMNTVTETGHGTAKRRPAIDKAAGVCARANQVVPKTPPIALRMGDAHCKVFTKKVEVRWNIREKSN